MATLIFLRGLCGHVLVNILTLWPPKAVYLLDACNNIPLDKSKLVLIDNKSIQKILTYTNDLHSYIIYFWFNNDLGQKYYATQIQPDPRSNSWPPDHDGSNLGCAVLLSQVVFEPKIYDIYIHISVLDIRMDIYVHAYVQNRFKLYQIIYIYSIEQFHSLAMWISKWYRQFFFINS